MGRDKKPNAEHGKSIELSAAKIQLYEREVSKINSRLATSIDTIEAELENLKTIGDGISTLYEKLDMLK